MSEIKKIVYTILLGLLVVISIPFLIEWLSDCAIFKDKKGDFDSWLSFLGSYLGGLVSGITTLLGIYIGIQYERNKHKKHSAIANREEVKALHDWCFSVQTILNELQTKGLFHENVDINQNNNVNAKARELEVKVAKIDFEWYRKLNKFRKEYIDVTMDVYWQKSDEKRINKLIRELESFWKELLKYY